MKDNIEEQKSIFYTALVVYCGSKLLHLSDTDLEGIIYEEFMFHYTDLDSELIDFLLKNKVVSKKIANKAIRIRKLCDVVFSSESEYSAKYVRQSKEWQTIFQLADEIQEELRLNWK